MNAITNMNMMLHAYIEEEVSKYYGEPEGVHEGLKEACNEK